MMDERNAELMSKSMALVLAILYIGLIIYTVIKYILLKNIDSVIIEVLLIIAIPSLVAFFARKDESLFLPRNFKGEIIDEKQDKNKRFKIAIFGSLAFALFCLIMSIFDGLFVSKTWESFEFVKQSNLNIIINITFNFVVSFVIFLVLSLIFNAISIRRYNKKMNEMGD
ncbi:FtsX-like permease family protein [Macrococcus armenti]|uniref:FtsX-like permease family protein n=1 Tax=Macrococcus armenti TaxID=2875764 RepID=UPI001CC918CA|nr:FtsX-like permease family protein [Macrococcus armenti]UBH08296.1 hypothetical protein LAU41_09945 [Macrococcus armenti]UBH10527.1 hypothetical protein LAU38_09865 [Macrococcus armenti]